MIKEINGKAVKIAVSRYHCINQLMIKVTELNTEFEYLCIATVCIDEPFLTRENMKNIFKTENDIVLIKNYGGNEEYYEWFKKSDIIKNEILGTIKSGFVDVPFHELTDEFQSYINEKNI